MFLLPVSLTTNCWFW